MIDGAATYADDLNLYDNQEVVAYAVETIAAFGREVSLSIFGGRPKGSLLADLPSGIGKWRDLGASRHIMTLGRDDDLMAGIDRLADAKETVNRD